jgi:hypothetical protein
MIAIALSQALINFRAISGTPVIACISPAITATDVASRIEKKQWELTALAAICYPKIKQIARFPLVSPIQEWELQG